jgi:hypothetical protein
VELLNFRSESDAPVAIRLVLHITTRAVHLVSSALFPVTSAGIRKVASIAVPICSGAEKAKKNPPRETLIASVK